MQDSQHPLSVIVSDNIARLSNDGYKLADFIIKDVGSHNDFILFNDSDFPNAKVMEVTGASLKDICEHLDCYFSEEPYRPLVVKKYYNRDIPYERLMIEAAIEIGFIINNYPVSGIWTNVRESILADILQATRNRLSKPEFISRPTCGHTEYDLISVADEVKRKPLTLRTLRLA